MNITEKLLNDNSNQLTVIQRAEQKLLPDILTLKEIVELWNPDKDGQTSIERALLEDFKNGSLVAEQMSLGGSNSNLIRHC